MSRGKLIKTSLKRILFRTAFVLVGVIVFAVGSFSLAKYVSNEESEGKASVAGLGIKVFELTNGYLMTNIDYTQVVPGADIPVPRVSLHLESEVSYTLYLKVTEGSEVGGAYDWSNPEYRLGNAIVGKNADGEHYEVVEYALASWWTYLGTAEHIDTENEMSYHVKYYSYNLARDTEHGGNASPEVKADHRFKAGKEYNYTGVGDVKTIGLLQGDAIIISQYYGVHQAGPRFSLAFEAYIRQTLS